MRKLSDSEKDALIEAQSEYIELLTQTLKNKAGLLWLHQINDNFEDVHKAKELRHKIAVIGKRELPTLTFI